MSTALFSSNWHRVAELRPRPRTQVRVQRQRTRDQVWYLVVDPAGGRQVRLNATAYNVIGRCNGQHTVQRIWDSVLAADGAAAPTQDEVIALLTRLDEAGLLTLDAPLLDPEALFERNREKAGRKRRSAANPLAFRVRLGNPSAFLARFDALGRLLLSGPVFWLWLAAVIVGGLHAATEFGALVAHTNELFGTPRFFVLSLLVFVAMKALHETAHGMAVRRYGGEVAEAGISLLLLVPAPYVDASAAAEFRSRRQRAIVAGIGVMVELGLAAAALSLWSALAPGMPRDAALVVVLIGTVSTLAFNGNPLMRFDAYFVLADALDLPNLAPRSAEYWRTLLQRWLLRLQPPPFECSRGERKWLLLYAPASFAWRLLILAAVLVWIGGHSTLLAALLGGLIAVTVLLWPAAQFVHATLTQLPPGRELRRAQWAGLAAAAAAVLVIGVVPLPSYTVAQGVVRPNDRAQLRTEVDGFVREIRANDGASVEAGTVLAVLDNPDLLATHAAAQARLAGLQHEMYGALLRDPARAQSVAARVGEVEAEIQRLEAQIDALQVRAQVAGRLVMPRQDDLLGRLVPRGVPIGYVLDGTDATVRVAVEQAHASRVRANSRGVSVQLAEAPGRRAAALSRDVPAATKDLPSAALGERGGGELAVDPSDTDGRRALQPVFVFEVTLPALPVGRIGQRAWVRFDHGVEPLAAQAYRRGSQMLLKHFNPST